MHSADNPVDLASRGNEADDKESLDRYHGCAKTLYVPEADWNIENIGTQFTKVEETEVYVEKQLMVVSINPAVCLLDYFEPYCSSWWRLIRHVAWLRRFAQYIRDRSRPRTCDTDCDRMFQSVLTCKEIKAAESSIVLMIQKKFYSDLIGFLSKQQLNLQLWMRGVKRDVHVQMNQIGTS